MRILWGLLFLFAVSGCSEPSDIESAGAFCAPGTAGEACAPCEAGTWCAGAGQVDGRWLALTSAAADGLGRMNTETLEIERLTDEGHQGVFLPSGAALIAAEQQRLFLVDLQTRGIEELEPLSPGTIPVTTGLAVSPDGTSLYIAVTESDGDLWIVDFVAPEEM